MFERDVSERIVVLLNVVWNDGYGNVVVCQEDRQRMFKQDLGVMDAEIDFIVVHFVVIAPIVNGGSIERA